MQQQDSYQEKRTKLKNPLILSQSLLSVSFDILICLVCSLFSVHFYLAAVPFTYIAEFFLISYIKERLIHACCELDY